MQVLVFKSIFCANGFKLALISKGLRLRERISLRIPPRFKLALISKGLRRDESQAFQFFDRFKLALISKGLRPAPPVRIRFPPSFKLALISKGLRRHDVSFRGELMFQACPDFKGIKTTLHEVETVFHVSSLP